MNKEPEMSSGEQSMVEIVARALCLADGEDPQAFHTKADYEAQDREGVMLTDHAIPLWLGYRKAARAAIGAMKPATNAMIGAGANEVVSGRDNSWDAARECFSAMIDQALKD